jgi:hypothetical protein
MKFAPHRKTRDRAGRPSKLCTIAAWAGLCLIAYATVCPLGLRPTLPIASNLEHPDDPKRIKAILWQRLNSCERPALY